MRSGTSLATGTTLIVAIGAWDWLGWERVDDALLTGAALASVLFTVLYWEQTRGFMNPAGRAVLWVQCALSAVLAQNTLSAWTDQDYPGRDVVRTVLYGALVFALTRLIATALGYRARQ